MLFSNSYVIYIDGKQQNITPVHLVCALVACKLGPSAAVGQTVETAITI